MSFDLTWTTPHKDRSLPAQLPQRLYHALPASFCPMRANSATSLCARAPDRRWPWFSLTTLTHASWARVTTAFLILETSPGNY